MTDLDPGLAAVAGAHGIMLTYYDTTGVRHDASEDVVIEVLGALGVPLDSLQQEQRSRLDDKGRLLALRPPPVVVAWDGTAPRVTIGTATRTVELRLSLEDGSSRRWTADVQSGRVTIPGELPPGRHRLVVLGKGASAETTVLSAPRRCHRGPAELPTWGGFLPLYALRTGRDWGVGDVTDLAELAQWLDSRGAKVVSTLPLLAAYLDEPFEPSPYAPVSRRFWNELYLDADALLGRRAGPTVSPERWADLCGVTRAKREALIGLALAERSPAFELWLAHRPEVLDYARFRAAAERRGANWRSWPDEWRDAIPDDALDLRAVRWHAWCQWKMAAQLESLGETMRGRGQALLLDLPLGSHPDGYDGWRDREMFVDGMSLGAPPDDFYAAGQKWGLSPLHPQRSSGQAHELFEAILAHQLSVAGLLRIDHVMGLHRQFWVPAGRPALDGVYVSYPAEELWAVVSLLSHRFKTGIVGEDLGTVPDETRAAMSDHGALGLFVAQLEFAPGTTNLARRPPRGSVASLNTHDLVPFAPAWQARAPAGSTRVARDAAGARDALLTGLAHSEAAVALVNLEDLWLEEEPQNSPGTVGDTNWCRRAARTLDEMRTDPTVERVLARVNRERARLAGHQPGPGEAIAVSDLDLFLFNEGTHSDLPHRFGAHLFEREGVAGAAFSVWAPAAREVWVIGDQPGWDRGFPLDYRGRSGVWEGFVPGAHAGQRYKFKILGADGRWTDRADPLATAGEGAPGHASIIDQPRHVWGDEQWMRSRGERQRADRPMSLYEVHLGSWRRVPEQGDRWLTYRELAPLLADYALAHHFTHVELLPVMEHPFYASWGYQVTGFFQATSRYGTPDDLRFFVDHLHERGLGVVFDWVPAHFPADEFALARFDGTHLYEHADPREGRHPDWDSLIFNYGRHEVRSFLVSSACWWLDSFHVDGLRVDAVASMLYRDYSRRAGEWIPNIHGGRENLEALAFIRRCCGEIRRRFPDTLIIAEESTAWPGVTAPLEWGGLGFHEKWDLGWMHDSLQYFSREPIHRPWHHDGLTFRQIYADSERFVLALSHDEVVHGKGSLLSKMPGDEWQQLANLRLLYGYQHALPGKKLLFMGGEFGQRGEWRHDHSLDWHLLDEPAHRAIAAWVTNLNRLHAAEPALHERDHDPGGFSWISCGDWQHSVLVLARHAHDPRRDLVVACNFTPVPREGYRIGLPYPGRWELVANSDDDAFGGSGYALAPSLLAEERPWDGRAWSALVSLPPLGFVVYRRDQPT